MSEELAEEKKKQREAKKEAADKKQLEHDETFKRARKFIRKYFDRLSFEEKQFFKVSNRE